MKARGIVVVLAAGALASCRAAPFYEQTYMRAPHNWAFRNRYPAADHLLNAFDYGHAILYETLISHPARAEHVLDVDQFQFIAGQLLDHPPSVPLDEGAVGPAYVRFAPEVRQIFDWAHLLHRQIYDIWADPHIPVAAKDARVAEVVRYYKSRADLALSSRPKAMRLMEGQPYSLAFRERCPTFNGLIWSYHWMQMALYEGMLGATNEAERAANIDDVIRRFRAMHRDAPAHLPAEMPMTGTIAPRFAARYPEAAIIFDNLHSLHDVVSDILTSPVIVPSRKRAAVLRAAAGYRDDSTEVMTVDEWRAMGEMMDAGRMGGAAMPARP